MKSFDKIIIVTLIVLASVSLFALKIYRNKDFSKKYVQIKVQGEIYKTFDLNKSTNMDDIIVTTKLGTNVIKVKDGKVGIIDADCPDQICVKSGWIDRPGENLVCLPHKVVIEIKGQSKDNGIDIISH